MIIIVILIIVLAFVVTMIILGRRRRNMSANNPIDDIHNGGTMGFLLGDSYDFCMSRLKHLDIAIDSNDYDGILARSNDMYGNYVRFGSNTYNNIQEMSFKFIQKKLDAIQINIDYSAVGLNQMYDNLQTTVTQRLSKAPEIHSNDFCKWNTSASCTYLTIMKDSDGVQLLLQVLKK